VTRSREDIHGLCFHWPDRRLFRLVGRIDPILLEPDGQGRPVMNWVYWLSGAAALVVFVYLIVALFKPEIFE
jgi:F subunit of K+-transporting ATPase (Potass_KdpF)